MGVLGVTRFFGGFVHGPLLKFGDLSSVIFLDIVNFGMGSVIISTGIECEFGVNFGQSESQLRGFGGEHFSKYNTKLIISSSIILSNQVLSFK